MLVQYTGRSHVRSLGAADFAKAGVEARKIEFPRNETVEVPDPLGKQLISNPLFGGEFKQVHNQDEPIGTQEGEALTDHPTDS